MEAEAHLRLCAPALPCHAGGDVQMGTRRLNYPLVLPLWFQRVRNELFLAPKYCIFFAHFPSVSPPPKNQNSL